MAYHSLDQDVGRFQVSKRPIPMAMFRSRGEGLGQVSMSILEAQSVADGEKVQAPSNYKNEQWPDEHRQKAPEGS